MRGRVTKGLLMPAAVAAVMLAAMAVSCGGSDGVSRHVRDRKAYALGQIGRAHV